MDELEKEWAIIDRSVGFLHGTIPLLRAMRANARDIDLVEEWSVVEIEETIASLSCSTFRVRELMEPKRPVIGANG